ncbi:hypothetical protein EDB87DRAFT_1578058 [Lactarius vividus]|nr:hypothetical protein EDB87DRAFT_1578058 [Lactarius vividus]
MITTVITREHAHDDHHDHDHTSNGSPSDNLIERNNVVAVNANHGGSRVVKPLYIELDAGDQRSIDQLSILEAAFAPAQIRSRRSDPSQGRTHELSLSSPTTFANVDKPDFEDTMDKEPLQQFGVAVGRDVGETRRPAKFSNTSSVTLFFPAETIRIYYVGSLERAKALPTLALRSVAHGSGKGRS